MTAYYNEINEEAAAWLRELIKRGLIADGIVDTRSIVDVRADDLVGFAQCHFFAGIGGWSLALRLAGWPDDKPVWTGSPPCQPFSAAGKQLGVLDERHLAPHFLALVAAGRPPVLFGEQVAAAVTKDNWLDDLLDGLEREGYATGAAVLPACGVGAAHIRQRLWFVAERLGDADTKRLEGLWRGHQTEGGRIGAVRSTAEAGELGGMAHPNSRKRDGVAIVRRADRDGQDTGRTQSGGEFEPRDDVFRLAESDSTGQQQGRASTEGSRYRDSADAARGADRHGSTGSTDSFWNDADWLFCRDGKWRPVESGAFPLVNGLPRGVGRSRDHGTPFNPNACAEGRQSRLRGYGNAIVPQAAAEIIKTLMESRP